MQLREFPTLAHVVGFVRDRAPALLAVDTPAAPVSEPITVEEPEQAATDQSTAPAGDEDSSIRVRVLEIVADMTGYPSDMLDLELDLEADLGIDTVKQAEIFASLRESYGIPRD